MGEAKPNRLKVYICRNYDGRRQAMVAASTLENAATAMRTPTSHMRRYGWGFAKGAQAELALERPGVVFFASITAPQAEWVPKVSDAARSTEEGE